MAGLLISCCNVGTARETYILAYKCLATGDVRWVNLDDQLRDYAPLLRSASGATGLCEHGDSIYVALQGLHDPAYVVQFDKNLTFRRVIEVPRVRDIHSMRIYRDTLYIASTGTNEVIRAPLSSPGAAECHVALPSTSAVENCHLNDYVEFDKKTYVLGHSNPFLDTSNRSGFVYCVEDSRVVLEGLEHPHTLLAAGDSLFVLNSAKCDVYEVTGERKQVLALPSRAILRGCAQVGDTFHFGLSSRRLYSRKRGISQLSVPADVVVAGNEEFMAWLYSAGLSGSVAETRTSFSEVAFEIYDILHLAEAPAPSALHPYPAAALRAQSYRHKIYAMSRVRLKEDGARPPGEEAAAAASASYESAGVKGSANEPTLAAPAISDAAGNAYMAEDGLWDEKSNIRVVSQPGQTRTVVAFAGLASRIGGMTPFNFVKSLSAVQANFIFVRDPERTWYNGPIAGLGRDHAEIAAALEASIASIGTKDLYLLGTSSGGFGALSFAARLNARRVLAFGPQTSIDTGYLESLGETRWLPAIGRIKQKNLVDVVSLVEAAATKTRIDIVVGLRAELDLVYANRLAHVPDVKVHVVPGRHNTADFLKQRGMLSETLRRFVLDEPLDNLQRPLPRIIRPGAVPAG